MKTRPIRGRRTTGRAPVHVSRGGFTLLELMVVLVLITLLSTLVIPSAVSAVRHKTVVTEGEKLAEMLRFAYMSAVTRHHPVQVNLDSQQGRCWVSLSVTALPWLEEDQVSRAETLTSLRLPRELRLEVRRGAEEYQSAGGPGWQVITFHSDGRADSCLIALSNAQGERYTIEIMGATGEIVVRDEDK